VANGLAGSFISRNNDVGGYWGLGKLRLRFEQINIDLLSKQLSPADGEFQDMVNRYAEWLKRQLDIRHIP
jgi:hypothetical protein